MRLKQAGAVINRAVPFQSQMRSRSTCDLIAPDDASGNDVFQSQMRSRSTCDEITDAHIVARIDVSISDEKPLHMRQRWARRARSHHCRFNLR